MNPDTELETLLTGKVMGQLVCDAQSPTHSRARLSAAIGVALVMIPDELWERMVEEAGTPCGRPMCDCHIATEELFKALVQIRETAVEVREMSGNGIEL